MKKLNNKGFTLIELLAVIIILAIVVGISIPAVTNIINDSKNNALGVAADAAEKYVTDQYALMSVDYTLVDKAFSNLISYTGAKQTIKLYTSSSSLDAATIKKHVALIEKMGFSTKDVQNVNVTINADETVCITVAKIPTSSQYYTSAYWNKTSPRKDADGKVLAANTSKGC